jgi:5-methylcytosine-specific restriction endonuclease McrA
MGAVKITPADKAFSDYIRTRDKWTCQRCGKVYDALVSTQRMALHCSHFKGRGKEATRFEPLNADALCYGCHRYFTAHPDEHYHWQIPRKGQDTVDRIILASNGYKKKSERALEAKYWKGELKKLEEGQKLPRPPV